jgi:hypothetical protein
MSRDDSGHLRNDWTIKISLDDHQGQARATARFVGATRSRWALACRGLRQMIASSPVLETSWLSHVLCQTSPDK